MSWSMGPSPASTTNGKLDAGPSPGKEGAQPRAPHQVRGRKQVLKRGYLHLLFSHSPYIIGTTNQPVKMTPNHGLHLSFR